MKKKQDNKENYLDKIPLIPSEMKWTKDSEEIVTLHIKNKGIFNKIAQKLFKKPEFTQIHLDETGSFIWNLIDGEKNIYDMGEPLSERFGKNAEPLYERLVKFFQILDGYGFIHWN